MYCKVKQLLNLLAQLFFFVVVEINNIVLLSCIAQESECSDKALQSRHPSSSFVDSVMVAMMKTQEPEAESPEDSGVLVFGACFALLVICIIIMMHNLLRTTFYFV